MSSVEEARQRYAALLVVVKNSAVRLCGTDKKPCRVWLQLVSDPIEHFDTPRTMPHDRHKPDYDAAA